MSDVKPDERRNNLPEVNGLKSLLGGRSDWCFVPLAGRLRGVFLSLLVAIAVLLLGEDLVGSVPALLVETLEGVAELLEQRPVSRANG